MKNIEALYDKSPHIHVHTSINTVLSALKYTMYTCICPLYVYQKIRGSLTQNELLKLFLYKSVQQTTTSFLVSWAAPVNSERASYYIIPVFVSQQINSAIAVHLTPIKGQKKGTLLKNQINFCSDTCMYDGKRNSL